jgi:stage II sporulation protein AA (anti-sigma F factor antagonist)
MDFPTFRIQIDDKAQRVRVALLGEFDVAAVGEVNALLDHFAGSGRTVLLDLHGVSFMDSTALGLVVGAYRQASNDGWDLTVTRSDHEAVQRLFALVSIEDVVPLSED